MGAHAEIYTGAFSDPVLQSQAAFRALMDCMARPGTIATIASAVPPAPLGPGAGAVALTLCDHDTPVWLSSDLSQPAVAGWLAFHSGAPVTSVKAECRFAFAGAAARMPGFDQFSLGTQEYPDRSTTIVLEIASLSGGTPLVASGPGIKGETMIAPSGLADVFLDLWDANRAIFPRGVDLILVSGSDILCLPRTTKLARKEG